MEMTAQDARDIIKEVEPKLIKEELDGIIKQIEEQARRGEWALTLTQKLYPDTITCLRGMGYRVTAASYYPYLGYTFPAQISWAPEAVYVEAPKEKTWLQKLFKWN